MSVSEIPEDEKPGITAAVRTLYFNNRLGAIARPEMLERGDGLARTFEEAERTTLDGWHLLAPLTTDDIEASEGIRR